MKNKDDHDLNKIHMYAYWMFFTRIFLSNCPSILKIFISIV